MSDAGSEGEQEQPPTIGTYEGGRNDQSERHGQAKMTFPNKDVYTGTYANGMRNGTGTYKWAKPLAVYQGEYKDGQRAGEGKLVYPDGTVYAGMFEGGKRHGNGTYTYVNGDTYTGGWSEDARHGRGTYTVAATGSKLEGTWEKGQLTGDARVTHADHILKARFVNGQPELPATITFTSTAYTMKVTDRSLLGQSAIAAGGAGGDE
ncbi:hypothetical protein HDU86_003010 [Geranomyces michiganensis]|nr:hypothetical protein HDU86_003010 [Geranomyces michiganensis]